MNTYKRSVATTLSVIAMAGACWATDPPKEFGKSLALMSAPGQSVLNRKQLLASFYRCAVELKVQQRPMPRVVFISVGEDEAHIADVPGWGHVYVAHHPESGKTVYSAWVRGRPRDMHIIEVFITVLNREFAMGLTDEQENATAQRLYLQQKATVEVNSLLEKHEP
jgi:hypothetical protein